MLRSGRSSRGRSLDAIEGDRLAARVADLHVTPIAEAPVRQRVLIAGEVQGLQVVPRAGSPSLEVTVADGSGRAAAVFYGRRRLGGVDPGRRVLLEGVGRIERGRLLLVNPAYTIVE